MSSAAVDKTNANRPYESFIETVKNRAVTEAGVRSSFDIASQVVDKIVTAESADDVFAANEAGPADLNDFEGQTLNVYSLDWFTGDAKYKEGLGVYVVFHAYDTKGNDVVISTGAVNVCSSLYRLEMLGAIREDQPLAVTFRSRTTANGTLWTIHKG